MSEEIPTYGSPTYGATNHDIIDVCRRITKLSERLEQLSPLLINISARLEALEDKLGDTGDGHSPDRSARVGSVSPLNSWENEGGSITYRGQTISKASPSKTDDKPRHYKD